MSFVERLNICELYRVPYPDFNYLSDDDVAKAQLYLEAKNEAQAEYRAARSKTD